MKRAGRSNTEEDGGAADTRTQQLLDRKNREIADLRQKLKEIQEKNDLQTKIKDKEIARLQKRIKTLEDEMRLLKKKTKEESQEFNEKLQKVQDDLKTTNENNDKLKMQVEQLSHDQPVSEQRKALIHLGELCRQVQGSVYKRVMPAENYVSWRSYKVKAIEKIIEKNLPKNKRKKAKNKWQKLKIDLNWNEDLEEAVQEFQKIRNDAAHPSIDEATLRDYVKVLDQRGELTEPFSKQRLNELIDIWKHLKQEEC